MHLFSLRTGSICKEPGEQNLKDETTMLLLFHFPPLEYLYKWEFNKQ
jgi:hypothetical protein